MNKDKFREIAINQTAALSGAVDKVMNDVAELEPWEKEIQEVYRSIGCGGSQGDYKRKVTEQYKKKGKTINPKAFTEGDDDPESREIERFPIGSIVLVVDNNNGHNYKRGSFVMIVDSGSSQAFPMSPKELSTGNVMSKRVGDFRPANSSEIDGFINDYLGKSKFSEFADKVMKKTSAVGVASE